MYVIQTVSVAFSFSFPLPQRYGWRFIRMAGSKDITRLDFQTACNKRGSNIGKQNRDSHPEKKWMWILEFSRVEDAASLVLSIVGARPIFSQLWCTTFQNYITLANLFFWRLWNCSKVSRAAAGFHISLTLLYSICLLYYTFIST